MEFKSKKYIVITKEPEIHQGYFASKYTDGEFVTCIDDAELYDSGEQAEKVINCYDFPDEFIYKEVEITYTIKNLKLS